MRTLQSTCGRDGGQLQSEATIYIGPVLQVLCKIEAPNYKREITTVAMSILLIETTNKEI